MPQFPSSRSEKRCGRCRTVKAINDFYLNIRYGQNIGSGYCKDCMAAYCRERHQRPKVRRRFLKKLHAYQAQYPERRRARRRVEDALESGRLVKGPCQEAHQGNCRGKIQGHHSDYSKPLEVEWLCVRHHHEADQRDGFGWRCRKTRENTQALEP